MNVIDILLRELSETWGYEAEELNDIREKMEELANSCFWEGYHEAQEDFRPSTFTAYGKEEDYE